MKNKESLKDKISNTILFAINWFRFKVLKCKVFGQQEPNTYDMYYTFYDDFKTFNYKKWRIGQPWGLFHPEGPHQYYGDNAISIKDHLILGQFYSPRKLTTFGSDKVYDIPYSVGLVSSIDSFGYGFYKFEIELPKGVGLWPAVWLSCVDSWPPEIDILEAYSDVNSSYGINLQSNFHYDFDQNKKSAGARNHPILTTNGKLVLSCWWTEDFIKIYYNGYLVRKITSEKILKFFRDKKMLIILNNAIRPEFKDNVNVFNQNSEFHIYKVSVWN